MIIIILTSKIIFILSIPQSGTNMKKEDNFNKTFSFAINYMLYLYITINMLKNIHLTIQD